MTWVELPGHQLIGIRAPNPAPFTLTGTNSWILGHHPAWLVDPGPAIEQHIAALVDELDRRGGLGGIALTHDHIDHAQAVPQIRERFAEAPLAAARGDAEVRLTDGSVFGPLETVSTPGHAPDHVAFVVGDVGITGDAVLGFGSVFISPYPGSLAGYLAGLDQLRRRKLAILAPGHGPPVLDAGAKLDEYVAHRLDRERRLVTALETGKRTAPELLDDVWNDVPPSCGRPRP